MALEKLFAVDSIRRAYDGARPSFHMRHHPVANRLEIMRKIKLGDALAVTGVRPQLLVGLRNHNTHDLGRFTGSFWRGLDDINHGRLLRNDLSGRLVLAQALERRLPDVAAFGKSRKFNFGDKLRLQPVDTAGLARRVLAAERAFVRLGLLEDRHDAPNRG